MPPASCAETSTCERFAEQAPSGEMLSPIARSGRESAKCHLVLCPCEQSSQPQRQSTTARLLAAAFLALKAISEPGPELR